MQGIDSPVRRICPNLDVQIKAFDERRRTEKLDAIRAFFDERIGELAEFLPWEAVLDKRWGNATYSEEQAHKDILVAISKCDSSIAAIRGLNSEFETTLLEEYKQCHDLPTVLKKDQALKRVKEIEERRKAEQEQRRQQAEAARAAEEAARAERVQAAVEAARAIQTEAPAPAAEVQPKRTAPQTVTLSFRVTGTVEQLNGLRDYMLANGIAFGRAD